MTDELESRLKALEEHMQACSTLAVLSATELVWIFAAALLNRSVFTTRDISQILEIASADATDSPDDSPEMKVGKQMLRQSIALLYQRLSEIEARNTHGANRPTLQ